MRDTGDDDDLRPAVRVLARLHRVLESVDSGLTLPQYRMLCALSAGGERSARLAHRLAIRKPTATALADGLVAAGFAERTGDPSDRRIVRLTITDAGQQALARAEAAYVRRLRPLLADLDRLTPSTSRHLVDGLSALGPILDRQPPPTGLVAPPTGLVPPPRLAPPATGLAPLARAEGEHAEPTAVGPER